MYVQGTCSEGYNDHFKTDYLLIGQSSYRHTEPVMLYHVPVRSHGSGDWSAAAVEGTRGHQE